MSRKMPQELWLGNDIIALNRFFVFEQFLKDLYHVFDMALGIDTPWNGEPHQLHAVRNKLMGFVVLAKHDRSDFCSTDTPFQEQFASQGLPGIFIDRDMWIQGFGVNINGMAAYGEHERHTQFM